MRLRLYIDMDAGSEQHCARKGRAPYFPGAGMRLRLYIDMDAGREQHCARKGRAPHSGRVANASIHVMVMYI